jgi:DNA-directed RNA polymerase subunit RPC12/RpoP
MCDRCNRDVTGEVDWSIVWITDDGRIEFRSGTGSDDDEVAEWVCPDCGGKVFQVLRSNVQGM